jgi:3-dehydroquinate synthase
MSYTLKSTGYLIEINDLDASTFQDFMESNYINSRKIIIVDENTNEYCLEYLLTSFDFLREAEVILIPEGESSKVIDLCAQIWDTRTDYKIDLKDVVINLGGGIVSDIGGFTASVYKRGIDFINIPTSLLAMVDASVGGKTGVDLGKYKNQLGLFVDPKAVYIDPAFLQTLPVGEVYNGFAEMLKHGLIVNAKHWVDLSTLKEVEKELTTEHIYASLSIKNGIVLEDPFEGGLRKKLNFGHTIGHALEGYFVLKDPISHGYAVALGILAESFISFKKNFITLTELNEIERVLLSNYESIDLSNENVHEIYQLMLNDKKNEQQKILCVLLIGIGQSVINQEISELEILESLEYLNRLYQQDQKSID